MLGIPNTKIIWGDLIISDLFDVLSVDDPPSNARFEYKQEVMANGKARTVISANNELNFSITINRDVVKDDDINLLNDMFNSVTSKRLRLVKEDGSVLVEYKKAILADNKFLMGGLEDAKSVDVKITWSVSNG